MNETMSASGSSLNEMHKNEVTILKIDVISLLYQKGLYDIIDDIFTFLDLKSLCSAELVSKEWHKITSESKVWKKVIEKYVKKYSLWYSLIERRGWMKHLYKPVSAEFRGNPTFYKRLFCNAIADLSTRQKNWKNGCYSLQGSLVDGDEIKCVQYDNSKIVGGTKEGEIKIWERDSFQCIKVFTGHTGPIKCLQYDNKIIISSSFDRTVRIWDVQTGEMLNTLMFGQNNICCFQFKDNILVTCSFDSEVIVWDMGPFGIVRRNTLLGHSDMVTCAQFDEKFIVSGSVDTLIKIWDFSTGIFIRDLAGHSGAIDCVEYKNGNLVSASRDNTIRFWDITTGEYFRILPMPNVTDIKFDNVHMISKAFSGVVVWDFVALLDPKSPLEDCRLFAIDTSKSRWYCFALNNLSILSCSYFGIEIRDFLELTESSSN